MNKIQLGAMNCHYRFYCLETFFKEAAENGYKTVEIWTAPQHFFVDYQQYDSVNRIVELSKKYDISINGICPEQTNPKPNNIAVEDAKARQRVFSYFKNIIDIAHEINANQVVITSGWAFRDEDYNQAYARSVNMMRKICQYADIRNINLAIETLQKSESILVNSAVELKEYVDEVDCSRLNVCLDIGAMSAAGDTIQNYFDLFGGKIIHSHFVDVSSSMITHVAWGDGDRNMKLDIGNFMKNHYSGVLSIENVNSKYYLNPKIADGQSMREYLKAIGG